jgi:hypothetical protein
VIVRLDDTGIVVGALHQKLLELGYSIAPKELSDSSFGASTLAAVLEFQSTHVGKKGVPLEVDGIVGDDTAWALEYPKGPDVHFTASGWRFRSEEMRPEARRVCMTAICDIGRREDGNSNSGKEIEKFDPKGLPWCAQAVSTWLEVLDGGSPFKKRLRSVLKIIEWGEKHKRIVKPSEALTGDIWCALRSDKHGHCELIVGLEPQGGLCLVGGNVGNAVRGTVRRAIDSTAIVRPIMVV